MKQKAAIEQEINRLDVAHADAILRGDLATLDKEQIGFPGGRYGAETVSALNEKRRL